MPDNSTIDFVVMFLVIGLLVLGLGSALLGWLVRTWDRWRGGVSHSGVDMSRPTDQTRQTNQTDRQTDEVPEADQWLERVRLDRTKTMLIDLLVYSDWHVGEIRAALKGDSGALGKEIEAARQRLGKPPSTPYRTPIAGRPTDPRYYQDDPGLVYEPLE